MLTRTHNSLSLNPFANMGCVYLLTAPNGKKYVGITTKPVEKRWKGHQRLGSTCTILKRTIAKYGWDNFKKEKLLYCAENELCEYERKFIYLYDTLAPNGMNCTTGGEINKEFCNESRAKISNRLRQYYKTHAPRAGRKGCMLTLEEKQKFNGCISWYKRLKCYAVVIPSSWNNGKTKFISGFKSRELAQAAIEEWRSKLIQ